MICDGLCDFYPTICVFLFPYLGEGIGDKKRVGLNFNTIANYDRFFLSHVLPRLLLKLNISCKKFHCEPHNTLIAKRQQL